MMFKEKALLYRQIFSGSAGEKALQDLANVCYANRTTFDSRCKETIWMNEGRRHVYLYIMELLNADLNKEQPTIQVTEDASAEV